MLPLNSCPIFIINLDCSPKRMSSMNEQLQYTGISYQRISAVKGVDLTADEINNEYSSQLNKKYFRYDLSLGEVGCYLSHRNIWRKMVEQDIEFAVILEDDLVINKNFFNLFSHIDILKKYEFIKLADNRNYSPVKAKKIDVEFELINYSKIPNCTTGYAISLKGAKKLLSREKFYRPVDIDIQFCKELDLSVYGLRPYPITENNHFDSNISTLNGGGHGSPTTTLFRNLKYRFTLWRMRKTHVSGAL